MTGRKPKSLAAVSAEVLAEVDQADRTKQAELDAVRSATAPRPSDVGELLQKVAAELRCTTPDVTYEDLHAFVGGRL